MKTTRMPPSAPMTMPAFAATLISADSVSLGSAVAVARAVDVGVSAAVWVTVVGAVDVGATTRTVAMGLEVFRSTDSIADLSVVVVASSSLRARAILDAALGASMSLTSCFTASHHSRASIIVPCGAASALLLSERHFRCKRIPDDLFPDACFNTTIARHPPISSFEGVSRGEYLRLGGVGCVRLSQRVRRTKNGWRRL
ncbi:hypothetical protein VTI74DRAFT_7940 [Chaetomium olivicolor]